MLKYKENEEIENEELQGDEEEEKTDEELEAEICKLANDYLENFLELTSEQRAEAVNDSQHMAGEHFSEATLKKRKKRVNLVKNDSPIIKRKIKKFWKKRESALKFHPSTNDETRKDKAGLLQGLGSHIERNSMSMKVQDKAFDDLLDSGMGGYYVDADYEKPGSFNRDLKIRPIANFLYLTWDCRSVEVDTSDAVEGGFYFEITKEEYEDIHGEDEKPQDVEHDEHIEVSDNMVLCFRYYRKEFKKDKLYLVADWREEVLDEDSGEMVVNNNISEELVISESNDKQLYREFKELDNYKEYILDERDDEIPTVYYWEVTKDKIIQDEKLWGGQTIPVVKMLGESYKPNKQEKYASCIRWKKNMDEAYDLMLSGMAEEVSTSPKTKWLGAKEKFAGLEKFWNRMHSDKFGYMPFNMIKNAKTGEIIDGSAPVPVQGAAVPAGWLEAMNALGRDASDTSGIQPEALGAGQFNARSGAAIIARSDESMDTSEVFFDARIESLEILARILKETIPVYYDATRIVRILGKDGKEKEETINSEDWNSIAEQDIDVYVDTGPSFSSQRKEENAGLLALMEKLSPQIKDKLAPFAVAGTDWNNAAEIESLLKKLNGPELYDMEGEQSPEMIQQQLQQLQQKLKAAEQNNEMLTNMVNTEKTTQDGKRETAIAVETIKSRTKIKESEMDNKTDILIQQMKSQEKFNQDLAGQMAKISEALKGVSMLPVNTQQQPPQPHQMREE